MHIYIHSIDVHIHRIHITQNTYYEIIVSHEKSILGVVVRCTQVPSNGSPSRVSPRPVDRTIDTVDLATRGQVSVICALILYVCGVTLTRPALGRRWIGRERLGTLNRIIRGTFNYNTEAQTSQDSFV